jgi:hypothetical protein
MKKINSFRFLMCCILTGLLSTACSKDSEPYRRTPCDTCGSISGNDLTPLYITDSNWVRKTSDVFESDLSKILHQAGFSAKQVYAINVVDEKGLLQIFPYYNEKFMDGAIYAAVNTSDENDACIMTFSFSKQDEHSGQMPHGGGLPFHALDIQILLLK